MQLALGFQTPLALLLPDGGNTAAMHADKGGG